RPGMEHHRNPLATGRDQPPPVLAPLLGRRPRPPGLADPGHLALAFRPRQPCPARVAATATFLGRASADPGHHGAGCFNQLHRSADAAGVLVLGPIAPPEEPGVSRGAL